jgi:hypothetical protein
VSAPTTTDGAQPYRVVYSEVVREALRDLLILARDRGVSEPFLQAVRDIDHRLRWYPQFGDPVIDLKHEAGQIWIGTVPPLVVRYAIFEERRLVFVSIPLMPLPGSGV